MKVGVIGAGIAGLAAARTLKKHDIQCIVFEKSNGVGGRVATRRIGSYTFDTGATSIAPRGRKMEPVMLSELNIEDLVKIERPIYVHAFGRVSPGDSFRNRIPRYTYKSGNTQFPKMLASDLDVRLEHEVGGIGRKSENKFEIFGESFDALILTPPIPESEALLSSIGESRPLGNSRYRSCISILLGYSEPFADDRYHAIIDPEQRHPLTWLSIETLKSPERAPEGHTAMVAQMSPQYSTSMFGAADEVIVSETVGYITRLYGKAFCEPQEAQVKRWRYSQPETTALFMTVNRTGNRVLLAGDGVMGARIEFAYDAGVFAAELLIEGL